MKKKTNEVRSRWVLVRMNQTEYDALCALYNRSTCRSVSEYIRSVVLKKTITFKYRDESADEILAALLKMKNELNEFGNNLNNVVHVLHMLDQIPEFRNWITQHRNLPQKMQTKLEEISQRLSLLYQQYTQKNE